jgi:hypothetical protein
LACLVAYVASGARLGLATRTLGAWPNLNERIGRSILAWLGLAPPTRCGGPRWLPLAIVYKHDSHHLARVLGTVHSPLLVPPLSRSLAPLTVSPPSVFLRLLPAPMVSTVGVASKPCRFVVCGLIPLSYLCSSSRILVLRFEYYAVHFFRLPS